MITKREDGWLEKEFHEALDRECLREQIKSLTPEQVKLAIGLMHLLKKGRRIISPAPEPEK